MFIRSVSSGGGYRGDVNSAFRQGRQDAFRDYVGNYRFALDTDVANNAENQRQVERIAKNYGLDLGMNQAARQDAYNFIKGSTDIDNAKRQMEIDFATNALLKDPTVNAEVSKANASNYVTNAQSGAVKGQIGLSNLQFNQGQLPVTQATQANKNQADLTSSQSSMTSEKLRHNALLDQEALVNLAKGISDEETVAHYIARYRELNPDSGLTDEQLQAEAMDKIALAKKELALQRGNAHQVGMALAAGDLSGNAGVYNFAPTNKGQVMQGTKTKASQTSVDNTTTPTVSSLGKTTLMSQDEFEKNQGNLVRVPGQAGVYRYGNAIVVQNAAGGYNVYNPNVITIGKDKQFESEDDLIKRALAQSGRAGQATPISSPAAMK